jgi:NAD(P)-dependent dehydrogenase (short-subunit alcohol dehydrogenase family)
MNADMKPAKTIVITGATAGIGLQSARQLAAQGHRLVLVGRSPQKLEAAAATVRAAGAAQVDTLVADLASLDSVRELADALRSRLDRIDVLVNNAGGVNDKRRLTVDGIESTFAVNHLAGFLLTERVLDLVVAAAPSRIVFTSSQAHFSGTMDFDDLGFERDYSVIKAYNRSKLANVLYARSLARQLAGTGVTVNALHPGVIATDIWDGAPWYARPFLAVGKRLMQAPEDGGRTITFLATDPSVEGCTGGYYEKNALTEPSELAQDDAVAERLREESGRLVGVDA